MLNRRELTSRSAFAAAALAFGNRLMAAEAPLDILFMGGTGFLGPYTVRAAVSRGHRVTLFNRGRTNANLFPDLETIIGDRNTPDIARLNGRRWDAVIDTSAYFPRSVNLLLDALTEPVEQYVMISTISAYETWSTQGMDETASLRSIADPTIEEFRQPATYGALKALCEEAANARMPGQVTNIRPGFIVGPDDPTDRFTYWPTRVARGGEVLAPGSGEDYVQYIDVRDLANWIVHCLEQNVVGTFNAHIGERQLSMRDLLGTAREQLNTATRLTWADSSFLERHAVIAQVDMPIWLPGGMQLSAERALRSGLAIRPATQTIHDTHNWFSSLPAARQAELRSGISAEREAEVLRAWHTESAAR